MKLNSVYNGYISIKTLCIDFETGQCLFGRSGIMVNVIRNTSLQIIDSVGTIMDGLSGALMHWQ